MLEGVVSRNRSNDKTHNLAHEKQSYMPQIHRPKAQCDLSMVVSSRIAHSVAYRILFLRIGCCWLDSLLIQYSFRGLVIAIATEFIPLPPLTIVSTMVTWESSQWLGRNIVRSTGKENTRNAWIVVLTVVI